MQDAVPTIIGILGICATVAGWVALTFERAVHRPHLSQATQDHRRLHRLSARLAGCVVELERMLEDGLPVPGPGLLPDSVAGHMVYLFSLREECEDFRSRAQSHNARISWPQAYLRRASLNARRCAAAQAALAQAADALRGAARVYEEGFVVAHRERAGKGGGRAPAEPLLLLSDEQASEIIAHRKTFGEQMRLVATHIRLRYPCFEHYRCTWPALSSEMRGFDDDPYRGETRPMGRQGFGPVPVLHPDARQIGRSCAGGIAHSAFGGPPVQG